MASYLPAMYHIVLNGNNSMHARLCKKCVHWNDMNMLVRLQIIRLLEWERHVADFMGVTINAEYWYIHISFISIMAVTINAEYWYIHISFISIMAVASNIHFSLITVS